MKLDLKFKTRTMLPDAIYGMTIQELLDMEEGLEMSDILTKEELKTFHMLCEVLGIKELILSKEQLFIHNGAVCRKNEKGEYEVVDERADLFAALRNVACANWPNLEFRSDDYITNYRDGEEEETEWEDCIVRGSPSIRCSICGHESVYEDRYCGGCGHKMKNGY